MIFKNIGPYRKMCNMLIQSFITNPHTFVPQDIVRITESAGLLNKFVHEF